MNRFRPGRSPLTPGGPVTYLRSTSRVPCRLAPAVAEVKKSRLLRSSGHAASARGGLRAQIEEIARLIQPVPGQVQGHRGCHALQRCGLRAGRVLQRIGPAQDGCYGIGDYWTNVLGPHQAERAVRCARALIERAAYVKKIASRRGSPTTSGTSGSASPKVATYLSYYACGCGVRQLRGRRAVQAGGGVSLIALP
jgi:hypothetical protein